MEQLSTLGVILGNPNSTTKAFANRKEELAREKVVREIAHAEVEALTQAVGDLKMLAD
jgi:hypothetical protein